MKKFRQAAANWLPVILLLLPLVLAGCWTKPTVVMPEARAVRLQQGQPSPIAGYVLSESALSKILEAAEHCRGQP